MTAGSVLALVITCLIVPAAIAALAWLEARLPGAPEAAKAEQRTL